MSSAAGLRGRLVASIAGAVVAAIVLGACVGEQGMSGQSQSQSQWTGGSAVSDTADDISIDVPAGWVRVEEPVRPFTLALAHAEDPTGNYGLKVQWWSPQELKRIYRGASDGPITIHVETYRDNAMADAAKGEDSSGIEALPDRAIGGDEAAGMSYHHSDDRGGTVTQRWFVWRHDGLWVISLSSDEEEAQVPVELVDSLDTVQWTAPGQAQSS